jgi:hypothetical protein
MQPHTHADYGQTPTALMLPHNLQDHAVHVTSLGKVSFSIPPLEL